MNGAPSISIHDLLALGGLASIGDPPEMTVDVLGRAVHVTFRAVGERLTLEARVASPTPPPSDPVLDQAALTAPGDTCFVVDSGQLVGRRSLVTPHAGGLYDAVLELGKLVVSVAGSARYPDPTTPASVEMRPSSDAPSERTAEGGYWCFVDAPSALRATPESEEVLAMPPPGTPADRPVPRPGHRHLARFHPRPVVLQAGTAVLVDGFGVPRVKCNCGNPLTAPTPVSGRPVYTGPAWPGFAPTTVVV